MNKKPTPKKSSSRLYQLAEKIPFLNRLKDLKIGSKLTIGFGILVVLTFASAGISFQGSSRATAKINQTDEVRAVVWAATSAQAHLLQMQGDVRGYLVLGEKTYQENYQISRQAFEKDLQDLETLLEQYPDADTQQRLADIEATYSEWIGLPEKLFALRDDQLDREPAYQLLATEGVRYAGEVLIATNDLIDMQGKREPSIENLAYLEDMAKFQGNFAAMLSALRGYVTTRNRIYRWEYEVNVVDNQNSWEQLSNIRAVLTPAQQEALDTIAENRTLFLDLPKQIFEILESEQWRQDLYLFSTEAVPLTEKMRNTLNSMVEEQQVTLKDELAAGIRSLNTATQLILGGGIIAFMLGLVMTYVAQETIAAPVKRLTNVANQIRAGDLEAQAKVESRDEIGILAETFNNMTSQLRRTLTQVRKEKKRADDLLEVVIPIGVELASEKDFNRLLEKMLLEAKTFCHADAGTLYLRTEDEQLQFVIVRNDTQNLALGGTTDIEVPYAPLPLVSESPEKTGHCYIATQVAQSGTSSNIADHNRESDIITDYLVHSLLTIPLKNRRGEVLGVLQLLNAKDPETEETISFDANLQQMMESFSSLAVAALEAYIREQGLRQEIQQLRIEIDEAKRQQQVSEIVDTDFFQDLRSRARKLRRRGRSEEDQEEA